MAVCAKYVGTSYLTNGMMWVISIGDNMKVCKGLSMSFMASVCVVFFDFALYLHR